jgi:cytochrome c553
MNRMGFATIAALFASLAASSPARAKATWTKKAQAEDPAIKSCVDCHTSIKSKDLNARGQFLVDKKKELKAAEIDFKWLKEYKPPAAK